MVWLLIVTSNRLWDLCLRDNTSRQTSKTMITTVKNQQQRPLDIPNQLDCCPGFVLCIESRRLVPGFDDLKLALPRQINETLPQFSWRACSGSVLRHAL
jgi:hypothetical protein